METTPKKNLQTDRALSSLKTTAKLLMASVTALVTYFADCHLIALLISIIALVYSLFLVFNQRAITILVQYFQRATKFNKIHNFFDEAPEKKGEIAIKPFIDEEAPKLHRHHHKNSKEQEGEEGIFEEVERMPVFYPPDTIQPFQVRGRQEAQASRKEYQQQYLAAREQYKKSFDQLCGQTGNRPQFQARVTKIRSFYHEKVRQLLSMHEANLRKMMEELQKHYQVKIIENEEDEKSTELVNVSIDLAFTRLMEFKERGCFPWTLKADRDERQAKGHIERIQRIVRDRKEIDRFLAPYYPLNQKLRQQVVQSLQKQITRPTLLGRQLVHTVAEIFNDRLRLDQIDEKHFIFKKDFTTRPSLEISQSNIHTAYHVDLIIRRVDKQTKIKCNPGEHNLWTLIGFGIEALKNKL